MASFRFRDNAWAEISSHLQAGTKDPRLLNRLTREDIETWISRWQCLDVHEISNTEAACRKVQEAVKALFVASNSRAGKLLIQPEFLDSAIRLAASADWLERLAETVIVQSHRVSVHSHRDVLIGYLLFVWEQSGGEARTSTSFDNGAPSGPLIRFLMAVTHSLRIKLSPHAARKLVRKHRQALRAEIGTKTVDEAITALRGAIKSEP